MFWKARSGVNAYVPLGVTYDKTQYAFKFEQGGEVIEVDLKTNPNVFKEVTFECWAKAIKYAGNGWLVAQGPEYGWSRAIAINDARLGDVGTTVGKDWKSGLSKPVVDEWFHLVGTFVQGGASTVYLNGEKGAVNPVTINGKGDSKIEQLLIGGLKRLGEDYNMETMISDVRVYNRVLDKNEVQTLFKIGRRSKEPEE